MLSCQSTCLRSATRRSGRPSAFEDTKAIISVSRQLEKLVAIADQRIADFEKSSDPEQRKIQERTLHELEDRIWLLCILPEVEAELERLKTVVALDKANSGC